MRIQLIRHAKTLGNLQKRYIGSTDEELSPAEKNALQAHPDQTIQAVYSSPLLRCLQTAKILFPSHDIVLVDNLRECHFGDFENKNYEDLAENPDYQKWIDGTLPSPPNGESKDSFTQRCCLAFQTILEDSFSQNQETVAIITHGGTIMSIMEFFALPSNPFYHWQPTNKGGFIVETNPQLWLQQNKVNFIQKIVG